MPFINGKFYLNPAYGKALIIEREPSSERRSAITGEVLVSRDFSTVRRIQVGMKDFTTKPSTPRTPR